MTRVWGITGDGLLRDRERPHDSPSQPADRVSGNRLHVDCLQWIVYSGFSALVFLLWVFGQPDAEGQNSRAREGIKSNMVDETLIADLGFDMAEADALLDEHFSDGTDVGLEALLGEQVVDLHAGKLIKGRVIGMAGDDVVVEVGLKSEGLIPKEEFGEQLSEIKIGDQIDVLLESLEGDGGLIVLSKRKADRQLAWQRIVDTTREGDPVEGTCMRKIKGGLLVDIGVPVFLPASQVDIRRPHDIGEFIGRKVRAEILKIDIERRNIVISRRKLLEHERDSAKKRLLSAIEEGQIVTGTVKNIADFGAFVDLGGIDGLLHITDMSWGRVNHPERDRQDRSEGRGQGPQHRPGQGKDRPWPQAA